MKIKAIIAIFLAAALMAGCSDTGSSDLSSSPVGTSKSSSSTTKSSSESSDLESLASESSDLESSFETSELSGGEIPYEQLSSTGVVWDYPIGENLSYSFSSANIMKNLEKSYGKTGADLEYQGEWCAAIISDLLIDDGYNIKRELNPCDITIELLNNGYAHFYCLREGNYDSLVYYGLSEKGQKRVIMTDREEFVPKRGDFVIYLWLEDVGEYNWSHIGMVAEDYDGTVLRTIEGNVGTADIPDDPLIRTVGGRERKYNETVVGFIRLDY